MWTEFYGTLDDLAYEIYNKQSWHDIKDTWIEVCYDNKWYAFNTGNGSKYHIGEDGALLHKNRSQGGISCVENYTFRPRLLHTILIGGE